MTSRGEIKQKRILGPIPPCYCAVDSAKTITFLKKRNIAIFPPYTRLPYYYSCTPKLCAEPPKKYQNRTFKIFFRFLGVLGRLGLNFTQFFLTAFVGMKIRTVGINIVFLALAVSEL